MYDKLTLGVCEQAAIKGEKQQARVALETGGRERAEEA